MSVRIKEVVLVTGASSGIGFHTAVDVKKKGYIVYGAARRTNKLKALEEQGVKIIELDVTDDDSMVSCVNEILQTEGRIDVLVNNAGYGSFGAVEDVPMDEARRQVEVNLFGLARMTQLVLPHMRKQRKGKIINVTSMGGKVHLPLGAWYHATKFAVEGFSDCLRMEVAPFGIDVVLVEPGGIKTEWGLIAAEHLQKSSGNGAYRAMTSQVSAALQRMYTTGKGLSEPKLISNTIVKAVTATRPKTRYLIGANAKPLVLLRRLLSDRMYDKILLRFMK